MIKYLIWDFDGVICDSKDIAFKIHNSLKSKYDKLPVILNEYDYSKIMNAGYDESLSKYLAKSEIDEYFLEHREKMLNKKYELKVFSTVIEYIRNKKIPSIIITATSEKLVEEVLQNNEYEKNIFDYILGRETSGNKAHKLISLCNELKVKKDEVVYIGDTLSDVNFCNETEIPIICIGYGYCPASAFEKSDVLKVCSTQEELIEYIDKEIII